MNQILTVANKMIVADRFQRTLQSYPEHLRATAKAYADMVQKLEDEQFSEIAMEQRSIQWAGEYQPVEIAAQQMELIPEYENFRGKRLADYFRHNANMFESVRFGREYSPVIYVKLRNQNDKHQFTNRMKSFRANEIHAKSDGTVRVWWD